MNHLDASEIRSMKVGQLREIASGLGIENAEFMRKPDLKELLIARLSSENTPDAADIRAENRSEQTADPAGAEDTADTGSFSRCRTVGKDFRQDGTAERKPQMRIMRNGKNRGIRNGSRS